jgi:hypothetical protein
MTPSDFAAITLRVVADQGFEEFQPTACFPSRRDIRALAGVPADEDIRTIAIEWAKGIAEPGEEFLVAFKTSDNTFKVVRLEGTLEEEAEFQVEAP